MYFKIGDIIIYGLLILIFGAGVLLFKNNEFIGDKYLEVYERSELRYRYKIGNERKEIKIISKLGEEMLLIENGKVRKTTAKCSGLDCTHSEISRAGQMIVCLPNEQMIKIVGETEDFDAILY